MNASQSFYRLLSQRMVAYYQLIRMDKPIGTLLLLWPMLIALMVASHGMVPLKELTIFVMGCFLMRSSGCAINDFADRHVDDHVARTAHRPLAQKKIYPLEALIVYALLALLAFAMVLCTNIATVYLSFIGLALASIYPFTKRWTHGPQLFLGFAFAWAIPMSYCAILSYVPHEAWLLYFATVCWALAYDTQYALVDVEDDRKIGVKSTAIYFGRRSSKMILMAQLCVCLCLLGFAYFSQLLGVWTITSVVLGLGLMAYQQRLLKGYEPQNCFRAFLNNQWLGGLWFLGFALQIVSQTIS